mmetsp:Transcript_19601/g.40656  ORF Transcript_19601/g.40656 Transcript_19601/m.40656 type:complete len:278 (-) Transcript_19601:390-1223(-)|eukprot:CAMPEP_0172451258 /NCGR_PEP_ID=MMETSP1065-20121228/9365_1 /TAXON_ID=265537 /ORGANISM="Amphiprora paludosa, Strain CCMP125" /LENGTH=277 /DNA_ID=CAMNT_0013203191 /DNA_START=215 /DNA_END=1048 /DNA_ORIENTATION=-
MTGHAQDSPAVVDDSSSSGGDLPLPRFNLRKRKANTDRGAVCLTSVNSAFLDGLFADVAEIQQTGEESNSVRCEISPAPAETSAPVSSLRASPSKKSRSSLNRSISRCPKSFKTLGDAFFPSSNNLSASLAPQSNSVSPDDLTRQVTPESTPRAEAKLLSYSKALNSCTRVPDISSGESPSFPRLPPAVSLSSCNTLTRTNSDLQTSTTENEEKDTYGWFIEMDEAEKETVDAYHKSPSTSDLAFAAPTAPEAANQDAEVEWAKAADTVDSVLGDFF